MHARSELLQPAARRRLVIFAILLTIKRGNDVNTHARAVQTHVIHAQNIFRHARIENETEYPRIVY